MHGFAYLIVADTGPNCLKPTFMQDTEGRPKVREFKDAPPEVQMLVDPTWSSAEDLAEVQASDGHSSKL